ncbi:ultraviolet-B receptor UVR8 isoform X1 [Phalaenopsis equestris]|uniref:ultraviolet-B receptor UVR8 isoform X1 n=1 Tax=Phalaenopsis equestris TaxID=78828 RepID=UPI0009E59ABC|nr:ultraviolet-B receptor UVR8 isoform X1 [Phalaenopsis equestris]
MALRRRRLLHLRRLFSSSSSDTSVPLLWSTANEELSGESTVEILSWGRGSSGQLGGGKEEIRFYPTAVASLRLPSGFRLSATSGQLDRYDVSAVGDGGADVEVGISCGLFHSSLLVDGRFWIWGKGDGGRLGFGHENPVFVPTPNPNLDEVRCIALGGIHSTALTRSGEVFTWGYGGFGALGHSVYHRELLPRLVESTWMGKISHLATSGAHTAVITDSGELYTWGRDQGDGRLGLGSSGGPGEGGSFATPSRVIALPVPVAAVCCGGFFTMALTTAGQLWSWGANSNYELGRGDNADDWRPKPIPSVQDTRIVQIASGGYHSLALTDKGEVFSWGHGGHGQLGHSSNKSQKVPTFIEALAQEHITYIACGGSSSAAVNDKGELYMWGNAKDCQLGVPGLPDVQPLPVQVKFLVDNQRLGSHQVLSVSIGASHAMCLALRHSTKQS